jgi:hypothetical protein
MPASAPHPVGKGDVHIRDSYVPRLHSHAYAVMPDFEKELRGLRSKRRRTRSHFGGHANIGGVAVTVSTAPLGSSTLVDVRMHVEQASTSA